MTNDVMVGKTKFDVIANEKLRWPKASTSQEKSESQATVKSHSARTEQMGLLGLQPKERSKKEADVEVRRSSRGKGTSEAGSETKK